MYLICWDVKLLHPWAEHAVDQTDQHLRWWFNQVKVPHAANVKCPTIHVALLHGGGPLVQATTQQGVVLAIDQLNTGVVPDIKPTIDVLVIVLNGLPTYRRPILCQAVVDDDVRPCH